MNLVNAQTYNSELKVRDFKDQMVAMRHLQQGPRITSTFDGVQSIQRPDEVLFWSFDGEKATDHGTTLLFPEVLKRDVKAQAPNALVGYLREQSQKGDSEKTVYVLEPLSEEELTAFRTAVTS